MAFAFLQAFAFNVGLTSAPAIAAKKVQPYEATLPFITKAANGSGRNCSGCAG